MKYKVFSICVALTTLLAGALTSCTNDEQTPATQGESFAPVKSTDFIVYSGKNLIGTTFGTRGANVNGNLWYQNWERPTNVTDEERAKVIEEFSKVREGAKNNYKVDWQNFWVQQVYKGEQTYIDGYGNNIGLGSDHMNHLQAFNNLKAEVISWWPYEEQVTVYEGEYEHINNFNSGDNQTEYTDDVTHEKYYGTTLMTNMGTDGRREQFAYHNTTDSEYHYEYIILEIDGQYYVGFDFYAHGTDKYPANKNMDVERDWVFNDWIVKISPANKLGETPEDPELKPIDPETPPVDPIINPAPSEVEVNLSVNDKKDEGDYIATKLSIHVRDITDVEVFIPVPAEYYCDVDDMDIVLSHQLEVEKHSPLSEEITYEVNGHEVRATVTFELGGIRIKTYGITAEVIEYLRETYADGITFKVWNYYNNTITRDALKPYLDASTITFTSAPDRYVNAFARLDDAKNPWDCTVTPPSDFGTGVANDGTSNYNVIYTKND